MFRLLFIAVFVVNFVNVAQYRRRAQAGERFSLREEGAWMVAVLRGLGLAGLAYVIVLMAAPEWVAWSVVELPDWIRWAGVVVGLGIVPPLMTWSQRHLGKNVTTTVVTREHHELVTQGPYRYVRHPLYMVGLLWWTSLSLISGSWVLMAVLAAGFVAVWIRTGKEEAMLEARFGEAYRAYRARTGKFVPRIFLHRRS